MLQRRWIIAGLDVGSIALLDGMAVRATVTRDKQTALVQEWRSRLLVEMALPATGLDVLCREQWLLPLLGCVMGLFHGCCGTLSTMAGSAAELRQRVRNHWMLAKSYCADIGESVFFQSKMAGRAAIGDLLLRNPNLLDAAFEMTFQRNCVSTATNEM